jgi:hypothetical protein
MPGLYSGIKQQELFPLFSILKIIHLLPTIGSAQCHQNAKAACKGCTTAGNIP